MYLYNDEDYQKSGYYNIPCECNHCENFYWGTKKNTTFCSIRCSADSKKNRAIIICEQCGISKEKIISRIATEKGQQHNFCSKECHNIYVSEHLKENLGHQLVCEYCNEKFWSRKKESQFCTNECRSLARRNRIKLICARQDCDAEFEITMSKFNKRDRHFCSQSCAAKTLRSENKKPKKLVEYTCQYCAKIFQAKHRTGGRKYCCWECSRLHTIQTKGIMVKCDSCGADIRITPQDLIYPHHFCNRSCLGKYRQENRTGGQRRSKIEFYLEEKLQNKYPDLNIIFCDRKEIKRELDIYIPDMKLAIEINGPFHYRKIYSEKSFLRTKNNDKIKRKLCKINNIQLIIVKHTRFTKWGANRVFNRICRLIDSKICK